MGRFISPDGKGKYLYGSGEDAVNYVWAFSYGFNCQFYTDMAAGLIPYRSPSGMSCEQLGNVYGNQADTFYAGQIVGRFSSSGVTAIEFFGGGAAVIGGGGLAIGSAGVAAIPGVAIAGVGVAVGVHGGGVLIRNLQNPPVMFAKGPGSGRINITQGGLNHVMDRHSFSSNWPGKSKFFADVDIVDLIREAENVAPSSSQGAFQRIIDAGRLIGTDRATGNPTSVYTVITNAAGDLITMFPGVP